MALYPPHQKFPWDFNPQQNFLLVEIPATVCLEVCGNTLLLKLEKVDVVIFQNAKKTYRIQIIVLEMCEFERLWESSHGMICTFQFL